jgi:Recombinase
VPFSARGPNLDTILTRSAVWLGTSKSGHDGLMEQVTGGASSRRRRVPAALKNKQAAESRAHALASTIRKLIAAGFVSQQALTDELNRRGVPTALDGSWHRTSVGRMLTRLGLITKGRAYNGLAGKKAADAQAKALASTIRALQAKGLVSFSSIARALNERKIPTALGGSWHATSVRRLLHRLKQLPMKATKKSPAGAGLKL